MKMSNFYLRRYLAALLFLFFLLSPLFLAAVQAEEEGAATVTRTATDLEGIAVGTIDAALAEVGYSGDERLRYDVSWTGGVKLGELQINISSLPDVADGYAIEMQVSTKGSMMEAIYPVHDRHLTLVKGTEKLPFNAKIWQKEGYRYRAFKESIFDQDGLQVTMKKDGKTRGVFPLENTTNDELSAFLNSRLMPFTVEEPFIVFTFADKKRIPVKVTPVKKERLNTIFGEIETFVVQPQLTFKGLYDKQGDTVIWYSADECRLPVQVRSKIVIGSLTARLSGYSNQACQRYSLPTARQQKDTLTQDKEKERG